jgi:hypothetical protein
LGAGPEAGAARLENGLSPDANEAVAAVADRREEGASGENGIGRSVLPESESTNVWSDEAAEAAFFADARAGGESGLARGEAAAGDSEDADSRGLPSQAELTKRITPEVREMLDELFRAKFIAVRRVPRKALKD